MKKIMIVATLTMLPSLAMLPGLAFAETIVGLTQMPIVAKHRANPIDTAIWYPGSGGTSISFGENPVFEGTAVNENASVEASKFPVILMSHGLGGNYRTLGWLSAGLAQHGAIVIAVNHPDSTTGDVDLRKALDYGSRVDDLEAALASIASDPAFANHIDLSRIYAAGFSFGGWTALSMGGLRGNLEAYAKHCATAGTASTHCNDMKKGGIDLPGLDATLWNASYKDMRIQAVAAIDPAFTWGLEKDEAKDLAKNVLLIGLGEGEDRLYETDLSPRGSGFAGKVSGMSVTTIAPASHFTALLVCKPAGEPILAEEHDDPVCTDPKGTNRKVVHDKIINEMAKHFDLKP
jgi:predicted dienelactone hydrolase